MPVILDEEADETWLNPHVTDRDLLQSLLQSCDHDQLMAYPVSFKVNDAGQENPECIEALHPGLIY